MALGINLITPEYGVTKKGNYYQKSHIGQVFGVGVGTGLAAYGAVHMVKSGALKSIINQGFDWAVSKGGYVSKLLVKNPRLFKYGFAGAGLLLGAHLLRKVCSFAGRGVDKILERNMKLSVDAASELN